MYRKNEFAQKLLGETLDSNYRSSLPSLAFSHTGKQGRIGKVPPGVKIVKSACYSCNTCCEVLVFVDDKRSQVLRVEGDPESPVTKGVLCPKGLAADDLVKNPGRLQYPMRRKGKRGGEQWEKISWEEALNNVAEKLLKYRGKYGPQSVAFLQGSPRGWSKVFSRLANSFGSVNHGTSGQAQCILPRLVDNKVTFGAPYMEICDFANTQCILNWGTNPPSTRVVVAADMMDARQKGAALIVVDPYFSETASKADIWLQLRPGTDTLLALSMINVIIEEGLYDREFVEKWTVGFEDLQEHIKPYNPYMASKITDVPVAAIIEAARLFSRTKPACIHRYVALDQTHDSIQACRAVSLLAVITGNIGIPGGNNLSSKRGEVSQGSHEFIRSNDLPLDSLRLRRGYGQYPFLCSNLCSTPSAHMPTLWETIASGEPYPVKSALIFGSNALVSYTNAEKVWEALGKLELVVVADLFMTPTAKRADIILPVSSWLERDNIISSWQCSPLYSIAQKRAVTVGEARSDVDIICGLAKKLGMEELFWNDSKELYDYLIHPSGLTFEKFTEMKRLYAPFNYRQYEKRGFNTPSKKIEIYSSQLEEKGVASLPSYTEPFQSPISTPDLYKKYPMILTTGARLISFRHTENRENPHLKVMCPTPRVLINAETSEKLGIAQGDRVIIETATGSSYSYAYLTIGIAPNVVQAIPGWPGNENINRAIPWGKYSDGVGTVPMRGLLCRVIPAEDKGGGVEQ